ncbi:hypothetical protein HDV00_006525 [Rhizophlyctis rosea]|nr:hypothetical protein HDV00_006525 [Rhizophlyctis rosea]
MQNALKYVYAKQASRVDSTQFGIDLYCTYDYLGLPTALVSDAFKEFFASLEWTERSMAWKVLEDTQSVALMESAIPILAHAIVSDQDALNTPTCPDHAFSPIFQKVADIVTDAPMLLSLMRLIWGVLEGRYWNG